MGFRIFLVCAVLVGACSESTNNTGGSGGFGGGIVSDLEVTTFISGLDKPWDIAWLPNGTVVVTERAGRLNVYVDGVDAPPFTVAPSDLIASGEGGMMGL